MVGGEVLALSFLVEHGLVREGGDIGLKVSGVPLGHGGPVCLLVGDWWWSSFENEIEAVTFVDVCRSARCCGHVWHVGSWSRRCISCASSRRVRSQAWHE